MFCFLEMEQQSPAWLHLDRKQGAYEAVYWNPQNGGWLHGETPGTLRGPEPPPFTALSLARLCQFPDSRAGGF